jgi:hypothetical protein
LDQFDRRAGLVGGELALATTLEYNLQKENDRRHRDAARRCSLFQPVAVGFKASSRNQNFQPFAHNLRQQHVPRDGLRARIACISAGSWFVCIIAHKALNPQ